MAARPWILTEFGTGIREGVSFICVPMYYFGETGLVTRPYMFDTRSVHSDPSSVTALGGWKEARGKPKSCGGSVAFQETFP